MDLENFENDIFLEFFNINLDKIIHIIFLSFSKKQSPKEVPMAPISLFASKNAPIFHNGLLKYKNMDWLIN